MFLAFYFNTYTTLLVLLSPLHPTHSAESSKRHRDVVRQKIAEYLQHAEELYQTYLLHKEEGGGGGGGGELTATVCLYSELHVHYIIAFSQTVFVYM